MKVFPIQAFRILAAVGAIVLLVSIIGCRAGIMQPMVVMQHDAADDMECTSMFAVDLVILQKHMGALLGAVFMLVIAILPAHLHLCLRNKIFALHQYIRGWRTRVEDFFDFQLQRGLLRPKAY